MSCYSELISGIPEYKSLLASIKNRSFPFGCLGLSMTPKALFIHSMISDTGRKAIILVSDEATAEKLNNDLITLGTSSCTYPARDFNFNEADTSSKEYEQRRIGALSRFLYGESQILISSAEAAMQRTIPPAELVERTFRLKAGKTISTKELRSRLIKCGYTASDMVEGAGQFSVRGDIFDIFPSDRNTPVRIEFWADEIDSISEFDIDSQRRLNSIDEIAITPVTEILIDSFDEMADKLEELSSSLRTKRSARTKELLDKDISLFRSDIRPGSCDKYLPLIYSEKSSVIDYLEDGMLIVCDSGNVRSKYSECEKLATEELKELLLDGTLCKELTGHYFTADEIIKEYSSRDSIYLDNFARGSFDTPVKSLINFTVNQLSQWNGSFKVLTEDITPCLERKYTVLIFAGTEKAAENIAEQLRNDNYPASFAKTTPKTFTKGTVTVLPGAVSYGMDIPGSHPVLIISYGRYTRSGKTAGKSKTKNKNAFNSLEELHPGDYVVHSINGIGIFKGIENVRMGGLNKDYITIQYAKGDILRVPVTKLELISKYIGPHEEDSSRTVKLSRLGTQDWEKTKTKVRKAARDIADDLIRLYAQRQQAAGYQFSPDEDMQNDFERRFEYDETDDQLKCINEIKKDMEQPHPMDRLLCGDVGFGKTEVALRAAFKCVYDGKQVAFLVPTTILAYQHYRTMMSRFEGFPVNVDMLSRFRNAKEQREIAKKTKEGGIDILVGTQRLLSKDVAFRDLGLLIIDEEQRFGVAQKEKLKEKFPGVDVLTLSATPIPRTLNLAMSGLRDLSVIEEAPMDRYPVQTYVIEHDPEIISQAISKELRRGGQVYYLHNVTTNIEDKAAEIKKLFPDANISIAHGKMNEEELSEVWQSLIDGETDILVCTTIIETGVDVPNVNTLIIEDANKMGLAQLHQLRGRVGRSTRRASAFFTYKKDLQLTEIADRRLSAIREFSQFGAGFKIAMRDLEIRGAGSLLGAEQSGNISSVGYDMYMEILAEEIAKQKNSGEPVKVKKDCQVDISIDAFIPEDYIRSYPQRIAIYKRIADIKSKEDSYDVVDELIDRYGEPPKSVTGLIEVALLRNVAAMNDITEITQRGNVMILHSPKLDRETLKKLSVLRGRVSAVNDSKPYYAVKLAPRQSSLECLEEIIEHIAAKEPGTVS